MMVKALGDFNRGEGFGRCRGRSNRGDRGRPSSNTCRIDLSVVGGALTAKEPQRHPQE
jgi:hypothetical protein